MNNKSKSQLIAKINSYQNVIHYFQNVNLTTAGNKNLLEICRHEIREIFKGKIKTRPYHIEDELAIFKIHEAEVTEFENLFMNKFEASKKEKGFKTHEAFAEYEYKYMSGIWEIDDITSKVPIAEQWLCFLEKIMGKQRMNRITAKQRASMSFLNKSSNFDSYTEEGANEHESQQENDLIRSTIEDYLYEFKQERIINEDSYNKLVNSLKCYLIRGTFPQISGEIKVGRMNKKLLGWNINRILAAEGKGIEIELLQFAKQNISIFKNTKFNVNDYKTSNLYKYFTTQTK